MMPLVLDISDTESLSDKEDEGQSIPKIEELGFGMTSDITSSTHLGEDVASSSSSNLRSSFTGMGFSPSLVDQVIKEKGEEDAGLLLDTLVAYSAVQGTKAMSSESSDSLLDDDKDIEATTTSADLHPKQEPDLVEDLEDDKRASLLMMNFPVAEVDFAISKLGKSAPINELVDFIMAAQFAESENCNDLPNNDFVDKNEDCNTEALFGTMDKTLQLLEMGFNEQEVSLAIEKLGSEVPILELANCICATQMGESYLQNAKNGAMPMKVKRSSAYDGSWYHIKGMPNCGDIFGIKSEKVDEDYSFQRSNMDLGNIYEDIKPKEEYYDEPSPSMRDFNLNDIKGKRPKEEYEDEFNNSGGYMRKKPRNLTIGNNLSPHKKTPSDTFGMPKLPNSSGRSTDKSLYGPPYFLYGNVVNLSNDAWQKVSQFLYALQPEFVNTQLFSALNRMEGYIHNLPVEDRFHIVPKSPMTIEEAIPHMKKWWPSWDTRKQLSCISSDTVGSSQICSSLGKMLAGSRGALSGDQQKKVLYYCRTMSLVWAGPQRLAPMEPEHLERILGYPINHTRNPDLTETERLESLKHCFQTDTLGFYLSVLKPLLPGGITLLSLFSGIGGAEVTLHRLGIYLKAVVSVEASEAKRKILRRWWQNTDQAGELVQVDDIQRLTSSKLEFLMKKFGGFDLVICQNPCTYSDKGSKAAAGSNEVAALDFTLYYEFVRVLQRVRTMTVRS